MATDYFCDLCDHKFHNGIFLVFLVVREYFTEICICLDLRNIMSQNNSAPSSDSTKTKGRISCQVFWGKFTLSVQLMASKPLKHTDTKYFWTQQHRHSPKNIQDFIGTFWDLWISIDGDKWTMNLYLSPLPPSSLTLTCDYPWEPYCPLPLHITFRNSSETLGQNLIQDICTINPKENADRQGEHFDLVLLTPKSDLMRRKPLEILFPPLS